MKVLEWHIVLEFDSHRGLPTRRIVRANTKAKCEAKERIGK